MEYQIISSERVADASGEGDPKLGVGVVEPAAGQEFPRARETPALAVVVPVGSVVALGSGDAPAPTLDFSPTLTATDIQDMILPDPSIVNLLPPLVTPGDYDGLGSEPCQTPLFIEVKDETVTTKSEDKVKDENNIRLTTKDLINIQKVSNKNSAEEDADIKFDLRKADILFRCETCQEMPISSETVHTCDFGHQVCGYCYNNGVRTCVLCKGHMHGNNAPLENVLRNLRQNYPQMFKNPPSSEEAQVYCVSKFYSLKPIGCPEDGCKWQSSARSLPIHFRTEHKSIPVIDVPLFKPCTVSLPKKYMENENGNVVALINLKMTDANATSEMFTDAMTCWVQSGAIPVGMEKALAIWVSCAYEESQMPPVLYNVRLSTTDGYSSFGGQMIPLHEYKDPRSVLDNGKCLLLFPKILQNTALGNEEFLFVELKFYLR